MGSICKGNIVLSFRVPRCPLICYNVPIVLSGVFELRTQLHCETKPTCTAACNIATPPQMTSTKYPTWEILLSGEYPSKKLLLILSNCLMKKQWLDGMDWVGSPVQISVGLKSLTVGSATVGCWFSPNGLCYPVTIG